MRTWIIAIWLLIPVLVGAYHFGPGQERLQFDEVAKELASAEQYVANEKWADAQTSYESALARLPKDQKSKEQRLRLELAKTRMMNAGLPQANFDLKALLDELVIDGHADAQVTAETREALASSQYYITWLMRLEGLPRADWEPEIESARQLYRLLAEQSQDSGTKAETVRHQEDLESAIRLARMDVKELQGIPLPSQ